MFFPLRHDGGNAIMVSVKRNKEKTSSLFSKAQRGRQMLEVFCGGNQMNSLFKQANPLGRTPLSVSSKVHARRA
jgi:hypothetical protein